MNDQEKNILEYLENSYIGAKMMDDISAMVRIARAIDAFKADPETPEDEIFTEHFMFLGIESKYENK